VQLDAGEALEDFARADPSEQKPPIPLDKVTDRGIGEAAIVVVD